MARKDLASLIRQRGPQQPAGESEDPAPDTPSDIPSATPGGEGPESASRTTLEAGSGGDVFDERPDPRSNESYQEEQLPGAYTRGPAGRGIREPRPSWQQERQPPEEDLPKYQRLLRKEARLREEQALELSRMARQLNRRKRRVGPGTGGRGERITEHTLIRVAVDVLLSRERELSGSTEEELLDSLLRWR